MSEKQPTWEKAVEILSEFALCCGAPMYLNYREALKRLGFTEPHKTCPFCGEAAAIDEWEQEDGNSLYRVRCPNGHALDSWQPTPKAAWLEWDTRG